MDACITVEKEIDKILNKFTNIRDHGSGSIEETITLLSSIKSELEKGNSSYFVS